MPVGQPADVPSDSEVIQARPVIVFGKTPCFGKCPHYTARLYADGRMQYEGLQYAPVEGNRELMLGPEVIRQIMQAAETSHFRNFKAEYSSGAADLPSTTLAITYPDGFVKTVRVEEGAPAELEKLFAFISSQIEKGLGAANDR
ncbi:DUF6438 domain-containing protein [Hymenobacter sp. BT728]|nr:DUF6438 domain-containing protein [Hymenobacter pini]